MARPSYYRANSSNTSGRDGAGTLPRQTSMPFVNTSRRKPRRWPLAFRFIKGSIHKYIAVQVFLHTAFATLVVFCDQHLHLHLGLPQSIIPSLSIVVGLMLVFRNQTSYNRFWDGRAHLTTIITSTRNLSRSFLTCSYNSQHDVSSSPTPERLAERADTERTAKLLIALLYATKNHLRGEWGGFIDMSSRTSSPSRGNIVKSIVNLPDSTTFLRNRQKHAEQSTTHRGGKRGRQLRTRAHVTEFADLVPPGIVGLESRGLGIPLQFTMLIEGYIKRGFERGWWPAPQAAQLSTQLNTLVDAYGRMETIRLTPVPVAILIHQKQVLGLFGAVLPFAMVAEQGWWAIPITSLVCFTLYGIDGIATQLEDPFGHDRLDINMDAMVEDIRSEQLVLMDEWKRVGEGEGDQIDEGNNPTTQDGSASQEASTSLGASTLLGDEADGSSVIRKRGEEGGEWFVRQEGGGKPISWGTVRFTDEL